MADSGRGHLSRPHTADVMLEAWGQSRGACLEEAVAALVDVYAEVGRASIAAERTVRLAGGSLEDRLLDLLDEVIFLLDTSDDVPVAARVIDPEQATDVRVWMATRPSIEATGAVPKAISRSELTVEEATGRVRCSFLVDV